MSFLGSEERWDFRTPFFTRPPVAWWHWGGRDEYLTSPGGPPLTTRLCRKKPDATTGTALEQIQGESEFIHWTNKYLLRAEHREMQTCLRYVLTHQGFKPITAGFRLMPGLNDFITEHLGSHPTALFFPRTFPNILCTSFLPLSLLPKPRNILPSVNCTFLWWWLNLCPSLSLSQKWGVDMYQTFHCCFSQGVSRGWLRWQCLSVWPAEPSPLSSTYWLEWDFLKYLQMLLAVSHGLSVFPGVSSLNTPVIRLQIFDGFYFLFGQWLKVHQRWNTATFPGVSWACSQSYTLHGGLDSQNMSESFDNSMYTHSPHFPVRLLISFSFAPTISLPQLATILNNFLVIVFEKCSEKRPHREK